MVIESPVDKIIAGVDRSLRTLTGQVSAVRPSPATGVPDLELDPAVRAHAAGLMRVNHAGEICAQALYEGQALTAKSVDARAVLLDAAAEERDHLDWCRERLRELDAKPSVLDPLFYAASFAMGAVTGLAGDRLSLGFVEATEDQVVQHLERHLDDLPKEDLRSRAVVEQMRDDEAAHGANALARGGEEFARPVKQLMTLVSRVMTETTYRV